MHMLFLLWMVVFSFSAAHDMLAEISVRLGELDWNPSLPLVRTLMDLHRQAAEWYGLIKCW